MVKIFPYLAGETLNCHESFLKQLPKKHVKVVNSHQEGVVVIVFCPIVSRFETDITTALSNASDKGYNEVILVAMHHTYDENYSIPNHGGFHPRGVRLLVDCLFFETKGLLECSQNKKATEMVSEELKSLQGGGVSCCSKRSGMKTPKRKKPQREEN